MCNTGKFKGAFTGFAEKWGDQLTSDHITPQHVLCLAALGVVLGAAGPTSGPSLTFQQQDGEHASHWP